MKLSKLLIKAEKLNFSLAWSTNEEHRRTMRESECPQFGKFAL